MRILCATDLLPKSEAAIERAGQLADRLGAQLTLAHVVVPGESHRALEQTLQMTNDWLRARVRPPLWHADTQPSLAVHTGAPGRIIPDLAARSRTRLLVLGPHRKRPLRDALEGTIAEKAIATKSSVLVVRGEAVRPYQRVLLALDLSDASVTAIRAAETLVLSPDLGATVIHAHTPPYEGMLAYSDVGARSSAQYVAEWKQEARGSVYELLQRESEDASRYGIHVEQKPAAAGILHAVDRFAPDLLVMGTQGGGRLRRALVGSVANRVLHETNCDVLIAPEGSMGSARHRMTGDRHATGSRAAGAGR